MPNRRFIIRVYVYGEGEISEEVKTHKEILEYVKTFTNDDRYRVTVYDNATKKFLNLKDLGR